MSDNEILGGLRNAVERGEPIERAVQTFINAGYNPILVKQAANELSSGITTLTNPEATNIYSSEPIPISPVSSNPIKKVSLGNELEGRTKKIVIGLIITFIILIAALLIFIFLGDKIVSLFAK